jgi:hypothetical protein
MSDNIAVLYIENGNPYCTLEIGPIATIKVIAV